MTQFARQSIINLNNRSKQSDSYYVSFFRLPENISNVLGKHLKTITRPNISFEVATTTKRGHQYKDKQQVRFSDISLVFDDDENSIVNMVLYAQMLRQLNKHSDIFGVDNPNPKDRNYKFDIKIELYNSDKKPTEGYVFKDCFISEINPPEGSIIEDRGNQIQVTLVCDNIQILVIDQFLDVLDPTP